MLFLVHEGGTREVLKMRRLPNAEREGMYSGQFTTARQGDYRIDLPIPDSDDELLTRSVKVRLPAREIEQPQRNDALLTAPRESNGRQVLRWDGIGTWATTSSCTSRSNPLQRSGDLSSRHSGQPIR